MAELLNAYYALDHLGPVLVLLVVGMIFAVVRRSERIKPAKERPDG
jgi:hypothetical protein